MRPACLLLAATLLAGCTASLVGKKVTPLPQNSSQTPTADSSAGLTYFLTKPRFTIDVKETRDKKKAEPVYDIRMTPVPDPKQRYEVKLESGTLTNDTFTLTLLEDGRLVKMGATSESQIPEVIQSLARLVPSALLFEAGVAAPASESGDAAMVKEAVERAEQEEEISAQEGGAADAMIEWYRKGKDATKLPALWSADVENGLAGTARLLFRELAEAAAKLEEKLKTAENDADLRDEFQGVKNRLEVLGALGRIWTAAVADAAKVSEKVLAIEAAGQNGTETLKSVSSAAAEALLGMLDWSSSKVSAAGISATLEVFSLLTSVWSSLAGSEAKVSVLVAPTEAHEVFAEAARPLVAARVQPIESLGDRQLKETARSLELLGRLWADFATPERCLALTGKRVKELSEKLGGYASARSGQEDEVAQLEAWARIGAAASGDSLADRRRQIQQAIKAVNGWLRSAVFGDDTMSLKEEPWALVGHWVVRSLRALDAALASAEAKQKPEAQIASDLKKAYDKAARAYATYIRNGSFPSPNPIDEFAAMVGRLIERDQQLQELSVKERMRKLEEYFRGARPEARFPSQAHDGNTSKAYKDYRAELDLLAQQINTRLTPLLEEKKKKEESLPQATEVTRTLRTVLSCRICARTELFSDKDRRQRLADLWVEFSTAEAVIFTHDLTASCTSKSTLSECTR